MSANSPADAQSEPALRARAEAERSGRPFLLYADRDGRQQLFVFDPGSVLASVGRGASCDLALEWDGQVSRNHARFERVDDAWTLVDDGLSSNGTFVNEVRVHGRCRLAHGDTLRFGTTTMTFCSARREGQDAAGAESHAAVVLSSTQRRVLEALCRPYKGRGGFATPAGDEQIAEELFLSVGEVRAHIRVLLAKLGFEGLAAAEARVRAAERALSAGLVSERDL